jgi:hypothetical protein
LHDARSRLRDDPQARCVRARIEDLADTLSNEGPLRFLRETSVHLVVFGWTAISHVPHAAQRLAALRAVRALCPAAPVLVSAWGPPVPAGRVRRSLRHALRVLGHTAPVGVTFRPWVGFVVALRLTDLVSLAHDSEYSVVLSGEHPGPWALLRPCGAVVCDAPSLAERT